MEKTYVVPDKFVQKMIVIAKKRLKGDDPDFSAFYYSGGNYDDAYGMGVDDGEIYAARDLLDQLSVPWE